MPDNVSDATLDILKKIQASIADLRHEMRAGFTSVDEQLRKQRRNSAGMLVMMRATAGDFDERVTEVEERLAALESRAG